jgi:hypothetical protein
MTTRLKGLLVTLEANVREDDAECIINAIKLISRVIEVKPIPNDIEQSIAVDRVRHELGQKLWKVIYPDFDKDK